MEEKNGGMFKGAGKAMGWARLIRTNFISLYNY